MTILLLNFLTLASLLFGLFFMIVGAIGLVRLPDFYNRTHAASKCITLGISSLLIAVICHLALAEDLAEGTSVVVAITKAVLVIMFQFVAAPIAAHLLSRAAHLDGVAQWEHTLADELAEDRQSPPSDPTT